MFNRLWIRPFLILDEESLEELEIEPSFLDFHQEEAFTCLALDISEKFLLLKMFLWGSACNQRSIPCSLCFSVTGVIPVQGRYS